jgi:predicted HD phosphohydrolase
VTVRRAARQAAASVLARGGLELRRHDRTTVDREDQRNAYVVEARAIEARHAAQTVDDVEALRRKYQPPVFGTVRVWDLVERLAQCVDPSDCALFCTSQQTHILQMLEAMARDGIDDPDLLLAVLVHDLGKLLLVVGEDPANVACMNAPIGEHEPGIGLDRCAFQWNHDEFGWSRLRDHVPDGVAWLVRHHSMDVAAVGHLMDERDRGYAARYFDVFTRYDHETKTPYHLPAVQLATYRDLVEDAFPQPIPF